ncbi:hypothetical protein SAMN05444166_2311 [Singulisphaera sp. GP187]|uniref:hypothetical protein n=1 Tax=Singulisphaera sp. GP187 TaxID=1882752 RepID=UPI0009291AA3|nr:hypothetical protein [Singulisphaera sp. GP187]SIO07356.1 hypothetical protein SAMN05444166_2311 [Singulisphaera sp. GP187]
MGRFGQSLALVLALGCGVAPRLAHAQAAAAGVGGGGASPYAGMYANPYANPYTNPFLNPYMTQQPIQGNAALYLFAAQQQTGGIGAGRLSGVRPDPRAAKPVTPQPVDDRRATDRPGAGASQFFNRSYQPETGAGRYFNRASRYNRSKGR